MGKYDRLRALLDEDGDEDWAWHKTRDGNGGHVGTIRSNGDGIDHVGVDLAEFVVELRNAAPDLLDLAGRLAEHLDRWESSNRGLRVPLLAECRTAGLLPSGDGEAPARLRTAKKYEVQLRACVAAPQSIVPALWNYGLQGESGRATPEGLRMLGLLDGSDDARLRR